MPQKNLFWTGVTHHILFSAGLELIEQTKSAGRKGTFTHLVNLTLIEINE